LRERFPIVETYRGVGIHDFQDAERIQSVVKPAIDSVHAISNIGALLQYAQSPTKPAEARLLPAAKLEAMFELAAEHREVRPDIDLDYLHAVVAGLDSAGWANTEDFGCLVHVLPPGERCPPRDEENQRRLREFLESGRLKREPESPADDGR